MAVRSPGAGEYVAPASVAASNPCLNCGTNVQLEFCPECGQHETDNDPTLKEFLHELAEEFLHWDGKLAKTYRALVMQPGRLTTEYLAGRRIRYVSPLRVYLSCSVLFFFLSAVVPRQVVVDRAGNRVELGVVSVGQSTPVEMASLDSEARSARGLQRFWVSHMARALRDPQNLQHATLSAIPKAMFLLVPLFAALIAGMYRDRRRKYPQHLVFALHVHAALFLALSVMLAGRVVTGVLSAMFQLVVLVGFAVYVVRATRTVYDGNIGQAIRRLSIASAAYFVAFVAVLASLFALIVLTY